MSAEYSVSYPPESEKKYALFALRPGDHVAEVPSASAPVDPRFLRLLPDEKVVLALINTLCVTTSHFLLSTLPDSLGITPRRLAAILARLRLVSVVKACRFESDTYEAHFLIYSVTDAGRTYLKGMGITRKTRSFTTRLLESAEDMKRYLAAQQYAVKAGYTADPDTCVYATVICESNHSNIGSSRIFRAGVLIRKEEGYQIVDGVRRSEGWEEELVSKLARIDSTLRWPSLSETILNPSVILVAEDPEHAEDIRALLSAGSKNFCCPVIIANDIDVFAQRFSKIIELNHVQPGPRHRLGDILRSAFHLKREEKLSLKTESGPVCQDQAISSENENLSA